MGYLKGLEHRVFGWKVLVLKYNLYISLSQEMSCWISDSRKYYENILKKVKCMTSEVNLFSVPYGQEMDFPEIGMVY